MSRDLEGVLKNKPRLSARAKMRECAICGFSWQSYTAYIDDDFTKCPRCGEPVQGSDRGKSGTQSTFKRSDPI